MYFDHIHPSPKLLLLLPWNFLKRVLLWPLHMFTTYASVISPPYPLITSSWSNFGRSCVSRNTFISSRFYILLGCKFSKYSLMILWILLISVVIFPLFISNFINLGLLFLLVWLKVCQSFQRNNSLFCQGNVFFFNSTLLVSWSLFLSINKFWIWLFLFFLRVLGVSLSYLFEISLVF
jgi:hypothetical protein